MDRFFRRVQPSEHNVGLFGPAGQRAMILLGLMDLRLARPERGTEKDEPGMRFNEGMRRVALALGVLGFLGCCWLAVIVPGDMIVGNLRRQREFVSVMGSPFVKRVLSDVSKQGVKDAVLQVPLAGVSLIHIGSHGEVLSFDKKDGTTVYKPEANSPWLYLSLMLLPVAGFFIPWGVVRGFAWIVSGFLNPSR
jgi:hypothetical protein